MVNVALPRPSASVFTITDFLLVGSLSSLLLECAVISSSMPGAGDCSRSVVCTTTFTVSPATCSLRSVSTTSRHGACEMRRSRRSSSLRPVAASVTSITTAASWSSANAVRIESSLAWSIDSLCGPGPVTARVSRATSLPLGSR
ncbi:MAG: hypothetical protein IPJ34_07755 [Myxococcales bacterium]|nr:hypothetical protein [Myxococcales bacterium]